VFAGSYVLAEGSRREATDSQETMKESEKLRIDVETSPRFEVFYAMHKLATFSTSGVEKWRGSARERLGTRVLTEALDIAPQPLMWAILADTTLGAETVRDFADVISAINAPSPAEFKATILGGVPNLPGSDILSGFERLLRDPADYRERMVSVLRAFWSRAFEDDFNALRPELERVARHLASTKRQIARGGAADASGIPIEIDDVSGTLRAGRGGYSLPLARVRRIVVLPSVFNLNRWWTKRDDGTASAELFFPLNDGTISPSDAVSDVPHKRGIVVDGLSGQTSGRAATSAAPTNSKVRPEIVFRALGDTTRYAIATILARSPTTPSDLSRQLKVSKPTITHHVHVLRDAGLIVEGDGRLGLDRSQLEQLSDAVVAALFSSEGKLKLSRTRKKSG
jgi:DNA-binding transcriptional ArsR family regulator